VALSSEWQCHFYNYNYNFLFTINVIRQMTPLFSKVDSNKLWYDVQNEENVICAKFGKDLFNISKAIGHITKWPRFLAYPVYTTCLKNTQNYFCYNYVRTPANLTIFGRKMANSLKLYEVHSFSTSPNSCQCITVLNADVPNIYITLWA